MGILSSLLNAIPFMSSFSASTLASDVHSTEGLIPFVVNGETYHTWYKQFGQLNTNKNPPLIVAHGGPGLSHDYLLPISDLAQAGDRAVIMYDQLGSSRSTHLQDKPGSFWTIDLFIDELENLIRHFNIQQDFDLLGHSWGGMLGMEYEVRRHPTGMRHLIVTNSLASMGLWNEANAKLASTFPKDIQEALGKGFADPEKYHAALTEFYAVHGCTVKPNPKEFDYSLGQVFGDHRDTSVPNAMFGGEIKEWDIRERLGDIQVPTLIINGRADISMDFVVKPLAEGIKNAKWITFEKSSHTPMWEEREKYMQVIEDFLISQS
ncbi:proline-specific peptidase [Collybia nuda]|uniref:Proline-specific peptidase n=1 Tax=Collybia nuda TaxID=64659 RepID=A0A9P6CIQ5_9AGAR|nr:proline-specific peptidase [Collybia nuda]